MRFVITLIGFSFWCISGRADDTPRGIYRAHEVPGSPPLLASGLAWSNAGLVIADRKEKRLVVLRPDGKFETLRKMTQPFGVAFDSRGKVLVSEKIDVHHIARVGTDDKLEILVEGADAGTPHFLAVHKNGTIYWSGFPDGGTRSCTPDGKVTIHKPRIGHTFGIALSPKQDWLYVTSKLPDKGSRAVWRFPVANDGTLGEGRPFFFIKDLKPRLDGLPAPKDADETLLGWIGRVQGLAIDRAGNFYIGGAESHTSGAAVAVVRPDGKEVCAMILGVPGNIASLALSGDERTLYITGAGQYRLHQVRFDSAATDAVFQYAIPVTTPKAKGSAFLWIPPEAKQVRGVVMAGMTLAERELVKDERIRKVCADEQLAIVFLTTGLGSVDIQKILDDLARASGYRELAVAPLFFVGHSAGGPQAKTAALKMADRCFGLMQYRGGAPSWDPLVPPGIPALMMLGQFDEFGKAMMRDDKDRENWENGRDELAGFRANDPGNLGSIVIEPGAGHFAWSDRSAAYLALFLRKAARARIPDWSMDAAKTPVHCKRIDLASGWLTDLTINAPGHPTARFGDYQGNKARAAWHVDRELAEATLAYHQGLGKKDQFIRWTDAHSVEAGARFFFNEIKWVKDGQTFEIHPIYADTYPKTQKDGKGPRWALAGKPVGHSQSPIKVRTVGGPFVAVGANSFRMRFDALAPATGAGRGTFLAYSEGDAEYRYTEQVGMMPKGFAGLSAGKEQTITFAPIGDLKATDAAISLKATSDAGLPVEYYVAYGPAIIEKGTLRIVQIPARATFPIEIKVVAYQFGRGLEPRVKTAAPVERLVRIVRIN